MCIRSAPIIRDGALRAGFSGTLEDKAISVLCLLAICSYLRSDSCAACIANAGCSPTGQLRLSGLLFFSQALSGFVLALRAQR
ncbi:MAG TPA: hypothetical protein VM715_12925 [Candidatus Acidoferrum sp.]|nr:hypothetical protein [Candidatus Acidoferrum sp.]